MFLELIQTIIFLISLIVQILEYKKNNRATNTVIIIVLVINPCNELRYYYIHSRKKGQYNKLLCLNTVVEKIHRNIMTGITNPTY